MTEMASPIRWVYVVMLEFDNGRSTKLGTSLSKRMGDASNRTESVFAKGESGVAGEDRTSGRDGRLMNGKGAL